MEVPAELREKYLRVMDLVDAVDPDAEPYKSKYEAKELLSEMEAALAESGLEDARSKALAVAVAFHKGVICLETEELSAGEEYLKKALAGIDDHLDPGLVVTSINIRNHFGIIWSQRGETAKAKTSLEDAERLYREFKDKSPAEVPLSSHELFQVESDKFEDSGAREIERVHTLTKFYLAQVYGSLKELLKSAIYCHETLRRQMEYNEYDSLDWALNSATLSQFFMERNLFRQARHHLSAASHVLSEYEASLEKLTATEEVAEAKKEELMHRSADVSRCWAKYGIYLLEHSKSKLSDCKCESEELNGLWFAGLDLSRIEDEIAAREVATFDEARQVFLVTQRHINTAKKYYTLEHHASDHVQIAQDHSQLLKHLMAFEEDEDRHCKMIKRRIDLLEDVLKELNPQYYLDCCRQLWFELGETNHDLMHIKFERVKGSNTAPTPHALRKINWLARNSIDNFNHFLDSIKDKSTNKFPDKFEDEMIKPALIAHFYLGRLYYKIITHDKAQQVENTSKSYECFKFLADFCDGNETARNLLSEELKVSTEMMALLQMKMLQLKDPV